VDEVGNAQRVLLPVGWYWNDSEYSFYYRQAVANLDEQSLASLGVRWVIVTNLWATLRPAPVREALSDRQRFTPAATFTVGAYRLSIYRIF